MVEFNEYTTEDVLPISYIRENVSVPQFSTFIHPDTVGRKLSKLAYRWGAWILRKFFTKLVDRLLEGGTLQDGDNSMFIGPYYQGPGQVKKNKQNRLLRHTNGRWYGIQLAGMFHKYFIRMPERRRAQLAQRLLNGQTY